MLTSGRIVVLFDALLLSLGLLMEYQNRSIPSQSILGALALLVLWQLILAFRCPWFSGEYQWDFHARPTHYVQAMLHMSIYAYLAIYWDGVPRYAPLILTQIVFCYLCEMLIAWSRGRVWHTGLGVLPVVFSVNLFMWFRESVFYLQLVLMFGTLLAKEFVTWNYGGRVRHIFNPSAFSLSVVSIILLSTNTVGLTHAVDIALAFETPPNYYEVIFLLGLVVQFLFIVTPVTFGAAFAFFLIHLLAQPLAGDPSNTTIFPPPVFLGMTFLVTDPATSPRTHFGRFLFGMAYAVGVTIGYVLLLLIHQPSVFDKLLAVPVVNLCVPLFDRLCSWISRITNQDPASRPSASLMTRVGWLAGYLFLFVTILPQLKAPQSRPFKFLPDPVTPIPKDLEPAFLGVYVCRQKFPEAYKPFGFREEIAHVSEMSRIYRRGGEDNGIHRELVPMPTKRQ